MNAPNDETKKTVEDKQRSTEVAIETIPSAETLKLQLRSMLINDTSHLEVALNLHYVQKTADSANIARYITLIEDHFRRSLKRKELHECNKRESSSIKIALGRRIGKYTRNNHFLHLILLARVLSTPSEKSVVLLGYL